MKRIIAIAIIAAALVAQSCEKDPVVEEGTYIYTTSEDEGGDAQ